MALLTPDDGLSGFLVLENTVETDGWILQAMFPSAGFEHCVASECTR